MSTKAIGVTKGRKRKFDELENDLKENESRAAEPVKNQFYRDTATDKLVAKKGFVQQRLVPWLFSNKSPLTNKTKQENESVSTDSKDLKLKTDPESWDKMGFRTPRTPLRSRENSDTTPIEEDFDTKTNWDGTDFYTRKIIGTGGFSTVYKASCIHFEGRTLALKQVNYESLRRLARNENECAFFEEFKLHRTLKHENIVKAVGFYRSMIIRNAVMVLEYCSKGDLQDYLNNRAFPVTYERSHSYAKQIAQGLEYLHLTAKMIHMDMKLENILISEADVAKLTDFGFSIKLHAIRKRHWKSRGGTRWYKPPEQLKNGYFDSTADIWAFGCIAFELIVDYHPFFETENSEEDVNSQEEEPVAIERMIEASNGRFRKPQKFEQQSEEFKAFILQVLSFSRLRRPTAVQLCSIDWISS